MESKDSAKKRYSCQNTIEFWGLWEQLNNPNFKGANSAPLGMKQEQMHSLYLIQHQKKAVKNV